MANISKTMVDKALRDEVFDTLFVEGWELDEKHTPIIKGNFQKINDRQYGIILTDLNGEQRYVRIGAIVAELREDMTAEELMMMEIKSYQDKQAEKAEKAKAKEAKIARDKAKREQEAQKNV